MDKRQYNIRKIIIASAAVVLIVFFIIRGLTPEKPLGKVIDEVSVPVLTKNENKALRRYNNTYHLEVGKSKGIKPLESKDDYKAKPEKFGERYKLVKIVDNEYYELPHLTNSLPYLQAEAKEFLNLLGERFCDELNVLGIREYRFSVTSILRTIKDQKNLRKKNVNATQNESSHYFGRTFDIAQTRFFERGNSQPVYTYRLRNILLRELIKLQDEGKCYVLLEKQTKCIHVTVR